jgi:hypothetical protein
MAKPNASRTFRFKKDFIFVHLIFAVEESFSACHFFAERQEHKASAVLFPERQHNCSSRYKDTTCRAGESASFCSGLVPWIGTEQRDSCPLEVRGQKGAEQR